MAKKNSGSSNKSNKKNYNSRNTYKNVTNRNVNSKNKKYNSRPSAKNISRTQKGNVTYIHRPVNKKPVPKKKVRRNGHRAFMGIMFTVLIIYLFGYLVAFLSKPQISVESVGYGTIDVPKTLNGIIVRDERVFTSPIDGQPVFSYSENERVKKGSTVCVIKKDDTADAIEERIEEIDKDILEKQKQRSDISVFKEDIDRIEKNISETMDSYMYKFSDGTMTDIYSLKNRVDSQITMRNNIWLAENNASVSELSEEKKSYESQLAGSKASVASDVSGIVSYTIDGMESTLPYDNPASITEEQTKMKVDPTVISKNKNVKAEDPLFKIVQSNVWYMTSYVPAEIGSTWAVGDRKVVKTTIDDEDIEINVTINSIEQIEKKSKVVFRSNESLEKIINTRTLTFKIEDNVYEGLKVPNNAIVEKTLLKIPEECIRESNGEEGVLKVSGEETTFIPLIISRRVEADPETGTGAFAYVLQDFETIRLGDTIVMGTGETSSNYTISEVETKKGVYVVNSSVANFKVVDVLISNSEYSIVEAGSAYGLKAYDNIVSDAKNIQESDSVY